VDYPVVFWGLDVSLGLRVNQYKLLVYLSLTLNSFNFCFKLCWYKQPIVSKKQSIVFLLLCCFIAEILGKLDSCSGFTQRILLNLKKFSKTFLKQFTPPPPSRLRPYILTNLSIPYLFKYVFAWSL